MEHKPKKIVVRRVSAAKPAPPTPEKAPPPRQKESWMEAVSDDHRKRAISLRVDRDVLEFFKSGGRGYQTRMNAVLRAYMEAHKD